MKVHNVMEDIVLGAVDVIFEEQETKDKGYCDSYQCKLDVACYVLNRIPPKYVLSGRGIAHLESDYQEKLQRDADLVALIHEGIQKVNTTRRPYFLSTDEKNDLGEGVFYNFPGIIGRIFNGSNFEPLCDIDVFLKMGGEQVKMMNPNWQNPCRLVPQTPGTFTFWPFPLPAQKVGDRKTFEFEIVVEDPRFEELHSFIETEITAEDHIIEHYRAEKACKIKDLYIFPK